MKDMKQNLMEQASLLLLKEGYLLKTLTRACFDIMAKKGTTMLLLKILEDANAIQQEAAAEMLRISAYVGASPLIIAVKAGTPLVSDVIYQRFSLFAVNLETLEKSLHLEFPFLKSDHAGLTARLRGDQLREFREQEGKSLGEVGVKLGVSKRMVQRYEAGQANLTRVKAVRLAELFGTSVFENFNILNNSMPAGSISVSPQTVLMHDEPLTVAKKYTLLGFEASETKKVPFDVIAKKETEIILTVIGDSITPYLSDIAGMVGADNLAIFKKQKPKGIPALSAEEFMDVEKAEELIDFVKEESR